MLFLVEDSGFEPMTFPLFKRDAMADSTPPPNIPKDVFNGGGERVRTDDLLRARQALSQLSYTPEKRPKKMVGLDGFEPSTSRLSGVRSNRTELQALTQSVEPICILGKLKEHFLISQN